jgi:hypothetical protein
MKLSVTELETLKSNSLSIRNAKDIAKLIESDNTVGGVFPNAAEEDFKNPDIQKFKEKWCGWWPVARILLTIAMIFTGEKADKVINALIKLGDTNCTV